MTRIIFILSLFGSAALFGCDRALDDRYEGLVVVPIQEISIQEGSISPRNITIITDLSSTEIPSRRPDIIPLRELTPNEVSLAANETALARNTATENLLAAQDANAQALARLNESQSSLNQIQSNDGAVELATLDLSIPPAEPSFDPRFSDNPAISGIPQERPEALLRSSDPSDVFLAEDPAGQAAAERARQATEEAAGVAAAEQLAAVAEGGDAGRAQEAATPEITQQEGVVGEAEALVSNGNDLDQGVTTDRANSLSLPLTYRDAAAIETLQELQGIYDEANYSLAQIIAGQSTPPLIVQRIPRGLGALANANPPLQKELFIKAVLPLCLVTNARINQERDYVLGSEGRGERVIEDPNPVIRGLGAKYQAATFQELRSKIQAIPVSLCLAQAIVSTNWGADLKVLDQNALFGSWVRNPADLEQILPAAVLGNGEARSVLFKSLQAATDAFALYLNRNEAFADFRAQRSRATREGRRLPGLVAAEVMSGLDPQDTNLTIKLAQIIRENQLSQYNLARLANGPRQSIPVL